MYPELFHIGPVPIRSFGLALGLTFLLGVLYVKRMTARDNKQFEPYLTFAYVMIFGGVLGARLFYVILHWSDFADNFTGVFNPFQSEQFGIAGLNLYGGILLAIAASYVYSRIKNISLLEVFDYFAPTVGLGLAVSRVGCFLNGCCFGTPTDLPWGISFPLGSVPYAIFGAQALHPAQLYSSLYGLMLFLTLHFMMKRKKFDGQLMAVLFMVEAVFRFVIEYVRYYEDAMWFEFAGLHPTYNQAVSLALLVTGLIIYIVQQRRARMA
jgi:phosphatidylglycerol:prolipoprotein diacylglycerol transferase